MKRGIIDLLLIALIVLLTFIAFTSCSPKIVPQSSSDSTIIENSTTTELDTSYQRHQENASAEVSKDVIDLASMEVGRAEKDTSKTVASERRGGLTSYIDVTKRGGHTYVAAKCQYDSLQTVINKLIKQNEKQERYLKEMKIEKVCPHFPALLKGWLQHYVILALACFGGVMLLIILLRIGVQKLVRLGGR